MVDAGCDWGYRAQTETETCPSGYGVARPLFGMQSERYPSLRPSGARRPSEEPERYTPLANSVSRTETDRYPRQAPTPVATPIEAANSVPQRGPVGPAGADGRDGADGERGESAYEIWLGVGNTGTEEDFLNSLRGEDGESAYEIWLRLGHSGSEADFLRSLRGKDGRDGEDGRVVVSGGGGGGGRGPQGDPGIGVPSGGTTGQVIAKASDADFDTTWVDQSGGVGGGNLDGGLASSSYGGVDPIDCGGVT